jgi:long-chain acyl-CoA synthetase
MTNPLLRALALQPADTVLLSGADGDWRAADILAQVETLSSRLAGCRVLAVLADNGPAWVMADLAAMHAGKVHLPLPGFFSPDQMAHALARSAADAVLTDQPERIGALDLGFGITGAWQGMTLMRRVVAPVAMPAGTAKISFTSGSTGAPKGVCLSAEGLYDTARAVQARLADLPIQKHLAVLPLALLLENVAGVYTPMLRGAAIHLPPLQKLGWHGMAGFDPAALHGTAEAARPDSLILVPELLKAWTLYLAKTAKRPPVSLDYVAVGGARVDPALLQGARAFGLPAYQGYGLTECGSVVSLNRPGDERPGVGRPLEHARVSIDGGEVRVRARAFLGYLDGEPPLTDSDGAVDFATGDLGELDEQGHLKLAGRRKNLLISSFGRNLSPEWVESAMLARPAIGQVVVAGDARPYLSAILAPAPGARPEDIASAVAAANEGLPDYARIGAWLSVPPFSPGNGLATGNGRPVRAAILDRFAADIAALYDNKEPTNAVL